MQYQVVEDPATEGEELIFLVKPENFCCGIPFCIDHRTIDIHRKLFSRTNDHPPVAILALFQHGRCNQGWNRGNR